MAGIIIFLMQGIAFVVRGIAKILWIIMKPIGTWGYNASIDKLRKRGLSRDAAKAVISVAVLVVIIVGWLILVS